MPNKHDERMQRYATLSENLQNLYSAPESGQFMHQIFQRFGCDEANYLTYAEVVGDTILGINRITDMPRLFQQKLGLSADEAQRMTSQLIDFLEPVVRREEQEATMKKEEMAALAQTFATPENLSKTQTQQTPLENVEPIRTMEQDIHRVHGYGAYVATRNSEAQEDTEKEQQ